MLVVKLECKKCGNVFDFNPHHYSILGMKEIPKRCPKCIDSKNHLEKVVIKRECIKEYKNVKLERLIIEKEREGDKYIYFSFGGRNFGNFGGASFTRKYLIYINKLIGEVNDITGKVVDVRVMQKVYYDNSKGVEKTNEYIVLDPAEGEEVKFYLYTLESYYKTTLAGYGRDRNYKEKLEPVDEGEYKYDVLCSVSSGSRSGRYGNQYEMIVADRPCKVVGYGER